MSKFKVGDKVVVINNGQTHDMANVWIENTVHFKLWSFRTKPENLSVGTIVGIAQYSETQGYEVYFVLIEDHVYMINKNGLDVHEEQTEPESEPMPNYRPTSITFREIRLKYVELFSDEFFSIDLFGLYTEVNYQTEHYQCSSEQDLFQILDALTVLSKFKV